MNQLHRQSTVRLTRSGTFRRRDLLKVISAAGLAAGALPWTDVVTASADELRRQGVHPALDARGQPVRNLRPKPGHANGGETKAIATSVSGIEYSENLPELAKVADKLCLVRSMTSKEGSHPRATYVMHTGYLPTATVRYPTLGSIVAREIAPPASELPSFVRIGARFGGGSDNAGLLGIDWDPFAMLQAGRPPENTALTTSQDRYSRRLKLLTKLEQHYATSGGKQEVADHQKVYAQAAKMVTSPKMEAFDLSKESASVQEAYGDSPFAKGCLLARRLIETGVTFVEVNLGNWDTHQDNAERTKTLCGQLDTPFAALVKDLSDRGMLDKTLVIWMGEFGRTPRINPRGGRDHYPRAFDAVLAGGGVKGGQVIGSTDAGGASVEDRPVTVNDLFRTICRSLSINADKENMSSIGRPIKIVDGGAVVNEVFG
jgi:uncharacterized protein (DUF1501 family)